MPPRTFVSRPAVQGTRLLFLALVLLCCGRSTPAQGESIPDRAILEGALARTAQTSASSPADVTLEDTEQRLGPFRIGGQDFVVLLHLKRLAPAQADRPAEAALSVLEIQDAS